ncbi:MAG: 23S rRNA (adenine(2503)-C(2))-methyltransferase RlmN, partial [Ruminococcus sp.]|nr:23S rRNA (adenine(2503)-C(2))-methyltransferase RlmN [Ruminococcus sp.]
LKENAYLACAQIERVQRSRIDDTVKYLFRLYDGEYVEGVLMSYHHGRTMCISSQVGCKMGCTFCATGKSGFSRSLTASEMIAQIRSAELDCNERISNVVLMGMGEPFDNYDNVVRFLKLVSSEDSLNIGMRHITISTCGIVPRMRDFADLELQCGLSVSLHAPTDEARSRTMPINRRYPISEVMDAARYYVKKTNRRITFEYALISGENDADDTARQLASLLKGLLCHVNLIPVNNVTGAGYQKSSIKRQQAFVNILTAAGINATVRRTLGSDIDASCGQLKRKYMKGDV